MTELVRERGVADVVVAHIVERAGVSRRTFYELFEDREDCLVAAFEHAVHCAAAVVLPAYEGTDTDTDTDTAWEDQIRAGLRALLGFLDEQPALGGLCVVDALAAKPPVLERRARVAERLVDAVHRGGADLGGSAGRRLGRIVAEGVVGAVLGIVHARLSEPESKPLAGLLNQLMAIVVLPYRGPDAAERELKRRSPRRRPRAVAATDPLRGLDMRLTYRTVRVLLAVSECPRASSREIADAAGVSDQGQISKLLWRLERLGLLANEIDSAARGESNAWILTGKGSEIEYAIRARMGAEPADCGAASAVVAQGRGLPRRQES
ncbi:MAG TPA: TetR/AcrR family transcriptional regulator [Solirubrobacteraceae bacterium]|jgi:AcrR family transcriptional regulator